MSNSIILDKINFTKPTSFDEEKKTLKCIISAPTPDRSNDIIVTEGINFSDFDKAGANVLFDHDSKLVIAHSLWEQYTPEGLLASPQFDDDELAMNLWGKASKRVWGWSVRVRSFDWKDRTDAQFGRIYYKSNLIEYSLTPIPNHPDCITKSLIQECLEDSTVDILKNYYTNELKYYDIKDKLAEYIAEVEKVKSINASFEDIIKNLPTVDTEDLLKKYKDLNTKHSELFDKIAKLDEFIKEVKDSLKKDDLKKQKFDINKIIIDSLKK